MPIHRTAETIRPTQSEFGQIAYDVMSCVYEIHNEFGRFFDEVVYKRELATRMPGMELELPVTVTHGTFSKLYKIDVLAYKQGIFEFKAAESIVPRHRGQTINYLLLSDLPHGKIINVRPEQVLLPVAVTGIKGYLHDQKMRMLAPDVAFKLTAFPDRLEAFENHARRLLQHTTLNAIHWANITHQHVTFKTIR